MWKRSVALFTSLALTLGCGPKVMTPRLHEPGRPPAPGPLPLKVHLRSGELIVLDTWRAGAEGKTLEGSGRRYTPARTPGELGRFSVAAEDIALLETNDRTAVSSLAVGVLVGLTLVFGVASGVCLADPKSCFGSCPTFYAEQDPDRPRAEGFSSSIARSLQARDVDLLTGLRPRAGRLRLWMRNEALETHVVRRVRLLSIRRPEGGRVFPTPDGEFLPLRRLASAASCRGPEGDCAPEIARDDGLERRSVADGEDLAAREELDLLFPDAPARPGVVIRARQSLLSTFLFYQTLAYMGRSAGEWLAALERGGPEQARAMLGMDRLLGGIEVLVAEGAGWRSAGRFDEAGPIAGDTQVIPLPDRGRKGPLRVRLRMAKGHWRLDQVAVAEYLAPVEAHELPPVAVERDGRPDAMALRSLLGEGRHLVTLPGDAYRLSFDAPADVEQSELFLESEGYYYEWIRDDWLREEDPAMVSLIIQRPAEALRRLAAPFKAQESRAEQTFWSSRFGR
jgi:hypothetical protein